MCVYVCKCACVCTRACVSVDVYSAQLRHPMTLIKHFNLWSNIKGAHALRYWVHVGLIAITLHYWVHVRLIAITLRA